MYCKLCLKRNKRFLRLKCVLFFIHHVQLRCIIHFWLLFGWFLLTRRRLLVAHLRDLSWGFVDRWGFGKIFVAWRRFGQIQSRDKSRQPSRCRHGFQYVESKIIDGSLQIHCHCIPIQCSHVDGFNSNHRLMMFSLWIGLYICLVATFAFHLGSFCWLFTPASSFLFFWNRHFWRTRGNRFLDRNSFTATLYTAG